MRPARAVLLAGGFATAMYGAITVFGFNNWTWMMIFYSYLVLALIISLKASKFELSDLKNFRNRLILVKDLEDMRSVKVLTGEEFRIKEVERTQ